MLKSEHKEIKDLKGKKVYDRMEKIKKCSWGKCIMLEPIN